MQHARVAVAIKQLHVITSFYYNYQNTSVRSFLVQKAHLSGHFSIFGLVFFVLKSLLGIVRQRRREKSAILSLRPQSHVRVLIYRLWAIGTIVFSTQGD